MDFKKNLFATLYSTIMFFFGNQIYDSISEKLDKSSLLPQETECGHQNYISDRIVGGADSEIGEFPWTTVLIYKKPYICGGTLINNRYVLTAAHCLVFPPAFIEEENSLESVIIAEDSIGLRPECVKNKDCIDTHKVIPIEEIVVHPRYKWYWTTDDIGLIRLIKNIIFTNYIHPICLAKTNHIFAGDHVVAVGWGYSGWNEPYVEKVKQKVKMTIVDNFECSIAYITKFRYIRKGQICAIGDKNHSVCIGDSGGPLMKLFTRNLKKKWYQEGIISYGVSCGNTGYPAVFTRISEYIGWIENNLRP